MSVPHDRKAAQDQGKDGGKAGHDERPKDEIAAEIIMESISQFSATSPLPAQGKDTREFLDGIYESEKDKAENHVPFVLHDRTAVLAQGHEQLPSVPQGALRQSNIPATAYQRAQNLGCLSAQEMPRISRAAMNGDIDAVRVLLREGQVINYRGEDVSHPTPLCYDRFGAVELQLLDLLISMKASPEMVTFLLAQGAGVSLDSVRGTPLQAACLSGDVEKIEILLKAGARAESSIPTAALLLPWRRAALLRKLLEAGVSATLDVDEGPMQRMKLVQEMARDPSTYMHLVGQNEVDVFLPYLISVSLEAPASNLQIAAILERNNNQAQMAEQRHQEQRKATERQALVRNSMLSEVREAVALRHQRFQNEHLSEDEEDERLPANGIVKCDERLFQLEPVPSPAFAGFGVGHSLSDLISASRQGRFAQLLSDGQKILGEDNMLFKAALSGCVDVIKLLLEKNCDVNQWSPQGTPLQAACLSGNVELMELLLKAGAKGDPNVPTAALMLPWPHVSLVRKLMEAHIWVTLELSAQPMKRMQVVNQLARDPSTYLYAIGLDVVDIFLPYLISTCLEARLTNRPNQKNESLETSQKRKDQEGTKTKNEQETVLVQPIPLAPLGALGLRQPSPSYPTLTNPMEVGALMKATKDVEETDKERDVVELLPSLAALTTAAGPTIVAAPKATKEQNERKARKERKSYPFASQLSLPNVFSRCATTDKISEMEQMLRNGAAIDDGGGPDIGSPLWQAALHAAPTTVEWLIQRGANVNRSCLQGTPLQAACLSGNTDKIELLLKAGGKGDPNVPTTALRLPWRSAALLRKLLAAGINASVDVATQPLERMQLITQMARDPHSYMHAVGLDVVDVFLPYLISTCMAGTIYFATHTYLHAKAPALAPVAFNFGPQFPAPPSTLNSNSFASLLNSGPVPISSFSASPVRSIFSPLAPSPAPSSPTTSPAESLLPSDLELASDDGPHVRASTSTTRPKPRRR